ncbi:MAG: thermonuclease family protein [Acidobacteria bacterium]|jgi:micrococcal nuclease|nr:thermonuclease family protein [Acidobacteriota bacterium]
MRLGATGLVAAVAVTAAFAGRATAPPALPASATVSEVKDGDTLVVETGGKPLTVRLIGIDTPEERHPEAEPQYLAAEAHTELARLVGGRTVTLVADPGAGEDRYGRALAYVETPDGRDAGAVLIEAGLARAFERYDYARKARYRGLEAAARAAGRGVWQEGGLAELRWIVASGRGAIEVHAMTGGRFAVVVDGWARAGVKGRSRARDERGSLDDAIWEAHRALGAKRHDPSRALEILAAAGFVPLSAPAPVPATPAPPERPVAPPPPSRRGS